MNRRPSIKRSSKAGSILLETILVIPLFAVLIGGILWLGDVILAKQKLVVADRYAAWNIGNRHRFGKMAGLQQEVQDRFCGNDINKLVSLPSPSGRVEQWSQIAWAGVSMNVTMPDWTKGWLMAGNVMNVQAAVPFSTQISLQGRDIVPGPSGKYEGHVVVMKSGQYTGTRTGNTSTNGALGVQYNLINTEAWVSDRLP